MPRKRINFSANQMEEILNFFINILENNNNFRIEAEVHPRTSQNFENQYQEITGQHISPDDDIYYLWNEDANKYGTELRIYFFVDNPNSIPQILYEENLIKTCNRPHSNYERFNYRINNNDLIWELFRYGFVLGENQDIERIRRRINNQ
jgi:hypothetical protein